MAVNQNKVGVLVNMDRELKAKLEEAGATVEVK